MRKHDLKDFVNRDEKILWEGRPCTKNFFLESVFNRMLPVSLLWIVAEIYCVNVLKPFIGGKFMLFLILFLLMPVWMYLFGLIRSILRYKNMQYVVTDKNVYVSGGILVFNYKTKSFQEITSINVHQGIIDGILGTGDIIMSYSGFRFEDERYDRNIIIEDISNYMEIYTLLKDRQREEYTDTMYPNNHR